MGRGPQCQLHEVRDMSWDYSARVCGVLAYCYLVACVCFVGVVCVCVVQFSKEGHSDVVVVRLAFEFEA